MATRETCIVFLECWVTKRVVSADSYAREWNQKTITITAYAETKADNRLINQYISENPLKFKRVIQKA